MGRLATIQNFYSTPHLILEKLASSMKYSSILSKTDFDGRVLSIKGRDKLVFVFVIVFFILVVTLPMTHPDTSLSIKGCCLLASFILGWACIDVYKSKSFLEYDVANDALKVVRYSRGQKVDYIGSGRTTLKVRKKQEPNDDFVEVYSIQLIFHQNKDVIPFPLESFSTNEKRAEELVVKWHKKLKLS